MTRTQVEIHTIFEEYEDAQKKGKVQVREMQECS